MGLYLYYWYYISDNPNGNQHGYFVYKGEEKCITLKLKKN